jgi:hypothetical protein
MTYHACSYFIKEEIMGWLVFEALLAGSILVGIIWWTIPKKKDDKEK